MTTPAAGYRKPLPQPDALTQPFWDATKRHELVTQRCTTCNNRFMYARELCPRCFSMELEWSPCSGRARVYSFVITRQPAHPAFNEDVPYIHAMVQLEEGPRLITIITDCAIDAVKIDMPVVAAFDDVTDEITLVKFRPA